MSLGKAIRMERIFDRNSGKTIIVPMDHGVTVGPISGLKSMQDAVARIASGGANAVLMHKGLVASGHRGFGQDLGLIVHLSASTKHSRRSNSKALVGNVEDAIKLGADAVSVHVNLGDENERDMLADLGRITSSAQDWGMPVLAMVYGRGPHMDQYNPEIVAHCARMGEELGADMVKVNYTGSRETFKEAVSSCSIPVVIAGGEKMDQEEDLERMVDNAISVGGSGLSIGRNVFQAEDPEALLKRLSAVVHRKGEDIVSKGAWVA